MNPDVTVCIATIPPRTALLSRALHSVQTQTHQAHAVAIAVDTRKEGAMVTRQRALDMVRTPLVAFLDDDDEFLPHHLEHCITELQRTDAVMVYDWFKVIGGQDPFPQFFGQPWNPEQPHMTTVTTVCRTDTVREVGGFMAGYTGDDGPLDRAEEYRLVLALNAAGHKIQHLPEIGWLYHHDSANTSGRADRW